MIKDTPEGQTHYACDVALKEGNGCCGCTQHQCVEAGAEGFLSQPQNTLNVIENARNESLDIIKKTISSYICSLANVDNPDKAEKSIKDTIWGEEPPQYSTQKLIALGKVQGALTTLSIISNYKPK